MSSSLMLHVFYPDRPKEEWAVRSVSLPAANGAFVVWPGHAESYMTLRPGTVTFQLTTGGKRTLQIPAAIATVHEDAVQVLLEEEAVVKKDE